MTVVRVPVVPSGQDPSYAVVRLLLLRLYLVVGEGLVSGAGDG